jgi:hypothetical protein
MSRIDCRKWLSPERALPVLESLPFMPMMIGYTASMGRWQWF